MHSPIYDDEYIKIPIKEFDLRSISEFIEIAKGLNVLGIKITKDNETVAEWHSEEECRRNIYSATKSFTSCVVGFAVQEGLISLNEKLTDAFSDDLPDSIDDNLKAATVRDLLTMCLGQEYGNLMGEQRPLYKEDDWVKMSLAIPFKLNREHILYIIMWVRILRAYLYKGVQAVTLFPILPQGSFHILESNVQRGKQILSEIALVQAGYSR